MMMRKILKAVLVIVIFILIGLLSYTGSYYMNSRDKKGEPSNSVSGNTSVAKNTNETNNVTNETQPVISNTTEQNNTVENGNETEPNNETKKEEVNNLSDEEKAIQLAKEKYGSTDNVYFRIEQIESNDNYIVSVRDAQTTRDIVWYTVNVKTGTVKQN